MNCKWLHVDDINRFNFCKRHAPIVILNPSCDKTPETVKNLSYTNGIETLTVYPKALCPCGDHEIV